MSPAWLFQQVSRQVRSLRFTVIATSVVFCLLVLVAGSARLGVRTVARWGAFVGQNVHVIAFLADDMEPERATGLAEILRRSPSVASVTVVEPADALARLSSAATSFGVDAKTLDGLETSYFPRSLEIKLVPAADLAAHAEDLAKRLRPLPGIAQVDAMSAGLARLATWVKLGQRLSYAALVATGALALVVLLALFFRSRRVIAERALVLAQLGATPSGIRLPASLWMAAAALVGGGLAWLVLALGWRPLVRHLEAALGVATTGTLPLFDRTDLAAGFCGLLWLGFFMGYLAAPLPRSGPHA